ERECRNDHGATDEDQGDAEQGPCRTTPGDRGRSHHPLPTREGSEALLAGAADMGTVHVTAVPPPGGLCTATVPPTTASRSTRPRSPEPWVSSAPPMPSSRT